MCVSECLLVFIKQAFFGDGLFDRVCAYEGLATLEFTGKNIRNIMKMNGILSNLSIFLYFRDNVCRKLN